MPAHQVEGTVPKRPIQQVVRDQSQETPDTRTLGEPLVLVPALQPDVAILQVQRADADGNAHAWGNLGLTRDALMAARRTILIAEEIVSREVISSDPNRVLGPSQKVVAVTAEPGGAHPAPVQGCTVEPDGSSARNPWPATIAGMSLLTDRVRIDLSGPPDALVDVTPAAVVVTRFQALLPGSWR